MGEADELLFVTEGDDAMPVLKPDRARGPQTRYAYANEFIEEDAAVRVASALWHEFDVTLGSPTTGAVSLYHRRSVGHVRPQQRWAEWGSSLGWSRVENGAISGASASLRCGGR